MESSQRLYLSRHVVNLLTEYLLKTKKKKIELGVRLYKSVIANE